MTNLFFLSHLGPPSTSGSNGSTHEFLLLGWTPLPLAPASLVQAQPCCRPTVTVSFQLVQPRPQVVRFSALTLFFRRYAQTIAVL